MNLDANTKVHLAWTLVTGGRTFAVVLQSCWKSTPSA